MDLDNNRNGGTPTFFFVFDSGPGDIPMDSFSNFYGVLRTP